MKAISLPRAILTTIAIAALSSCAFTQTTILDSLRRTEFIHCAELKPINHAEVRHSILEEIASYGTFSGRAVVKVLLETDGTVLDYEMKKSPHTIVTQAVEHHICGLRFMPPVSCDGMPSKPTWVFVVFRMQG